MSTLRATNFQHASAAAPAIVLAADGTAAATVSAINSGPLAGFRNAIINGNFDIWQRGTANFGQGFLADRWNAFLAAGVSMLQSRYTLTAAERNVVGFESVFGWQVYTGDTTSSVIIQQPIEGVRTFADRQVCLSFWAFTDAGTCAISGLFAQYFGSGGSPSASVNTLLTLSETTITTTPTKITAVVTVPSITGKTLGTNGDDYLGLQIRKLAGAANRLRITGVQVEPGPVATPFERRPIGTELALCYRYYIQLAESNLMGGANQRRYASSGGVVWQAGGAIFPSTMRATPNASTSGTVTYSNASGLAYDVTPRGVRTEVVPTAAGIYTWGGAATHIFDAEL